MARRRTGLSRFLNLARITDLDDMVDVLRFKRRYGGHCADLWAPYADAVERVRSGFLQSDPRHLGSSLGTSLQELAATLLLGTFIVVLFTLAGAGGLIEVLGALLIRPGFWYWVITIAGGAFLWIGVGLLVRVLLLDRGPARRRLRMAGEILAALEGYVAPDRWVHVEFGFADREQTGSSKRDRPIYRTAPDQSAAWMSYPYFELHVACALAEGRALLVGYNDGSSRPGPLLDVLLVAWQGGRHETLSHVELDLSGEDPVDPVAIVRSLLADRVAPVAAPAPTPWPDAVTRRAFLLEQLLHFPTVLLVGAAAGWLWWDHIHEQSAPLLGWLATSGWGRWCLAHGAEPVGAYVATFAFTQVAYLLQERYELTARFFPPPPRSAPSSA